MNVKTRGIKLILYRGLNSIHGEGLLRAEIDIIKQIMA